MLVWFLMFTTSSPEELSTQDRAPYSMVTGMEGGSRWMRCSMGLLAQPRDSVMARKPTSPLEKGMENRRGDRLAELAGDRGLMSVSVLLWHSDKFYFKSLILYPFSDLNFLSHTLAEQPCTINY